MTPRKKFTSRSRKPYLIELKENGKVYWKNELIAENDLIPEM